MAQREDIYSGGRPKPTTCSGAGGWRSVLQQAAGPGFVKAGDGKMQRSSLSKGNKNLEQDFFFIQTLEVRFAWNYNLYCCGLTYVQLVIQRNFALRTTIFIVAVVVIGAIIAWSHSSVAGELVTVCYTRMCLPSPRESQLTPGVQQVLATSAYWYPIPSAWAHYVKVLIFISFL